MAQQEIERQFRVGRIVLGATRLERLTVLGERRRVNRKQREEVVLLQCSDDRPLGQFKGNRDRTTEAPL
jgi:precorrin-6B methylase 2